MPQKAGLFSIVRPGRRSNGRNMQVDGFDSGIAAYGSTMNDVLAREIRRQQYAVYCRQGPLLMLISLLVAVLVAVVALVQVPTAILAGWFIAVVLVSLYPLRAWLLMRRNPRGLSGSRGVLGRAVGQCLVAGLIWGSAAPLFVPYLGSEQLIFVALILAAMASGALVVLATIPAAAAAYAIPPALPAIFLFLTSDNLAFVAMGLMIAAFFGTMLLATRSYLPSLVGGLRTHLVDSVAHELQEQRFRDFATAAGDWLWETDSRGNFVFLSADSRARPRLQPISDLLRRPTGIDASHVFDPHNHLQALAAVQQRNRFRDLIYTISTRDGRTLHLRASGQPRLTEDGSFAGYRGTVAEVVDDADPALSAHA